MYTFSDLEKYLDTVPAKEKTPGGSIRVFHHGNEVFRYFSKSLNVYIITSFIYFQPFYFLF